MSLPEVPPPTVTASRGRSVGRTAAFLLLCAGLMVPEPGSAVEFFVAPDGDDANPGSRQQPFSSLERARDAVRASRAGGPGGTGATVWIREGRYYRNAEFRLGPGNSGSEGAPVAYRA